WLTVMTSSPGFTPATSKARCSAVVQLDVAQAYVAPTQAANSDSNAATCGPCVTQPDRSTSPTAPTSSSPIHGFAIGMTGLGSGAFKDVLDFPISRFFG